ncbi:MAG: SdpI family protein [Planctomycetota bacterium]|jgi:uncharacterized membrane protein
MRKIRKTEIVLLGLVALSLGIALSFYPHLPVEIPAGWDFNDNVVVTIPKDVIVFVSPFGLVGFLLIIMTASRIRPSREKQERFAMCYDRFAILLFLWHICLMLQLVLWPVGLRMSFFLVFALGIGVLCFYFGVMFQKAQKDWFIALRTRWTLSSREVWDKTHRLGGALFKIAGIGAVVGAFLPPCYGMFLVTFPIACAITGLAIYAYVFGYFMYRNRMRA